jgi:hypothetical protein
MLYCNGKITDNKWKQIFLASVENKKGRGKKAE